jgi:exodeoxyribonuclease-1
MHTFLWHDYETFGSNTRQTRPAQFAAIRTDAELNPIGTPVMLYCQPANDFLPEPQACLITGITPQECLEKGLPEYQFAAQIEQVFSEPGTVGVGYNTIRFDDEITRFMFWRNLIDPYAREWQNECGRWDLLDVVRCCYALRPEGLAWPKHEDGRTSFKLEHLTAANGLMHATAHDALSDVRATIALARLVKRSNPRLWDFCLKLRRKDAVQQEFGFGAPRPVLHISGMYPAEQGCMALVWPLAQHPTNKNEIIVWDLAHDPSQLAGLDAATLRLRIFTKQDELEEGVTRLPIKSVHINKSPIVIGNLKVLSSERAAHWGLDVDAAMRHAEIAAAMPALPAKLWSEVYARPAPEQASDVDEDLYGGFVGNNDRRILTKLIGMSAAQLASQHPAFEDRRLEELLFRYRARNFPASLSEAEQQRWQRHCAERLHQGQGGSETLSRFFERIDSLSEDADERGQAILGALYDYAESIAPPLD